MPANDRRDLIRRLKVNLSETQMANADVTVLTSWALAASLGVRNSVGAIAAELSWFDSC